VAMHDIRFWQLALGTSFLESLVRLAFWDGADRFDLSGPIHRPSHMLREGIASRSR
jgi:hypothetical protein